MEKNVMKAKRRKVIGKQVKALRREGKLPAVIYGHGIEPTAITLEAHETNKVLSNVGSSTLITIDLEGEEYSVLVRDRQHHVLRRHLLHVDFQALSMTETVRASVAVILGEEEAPAVSSYGAMIITGVESLEIECLPSDLVDRIIVNILGLESIGDSILVKDLPVPDGITILDDPNTMVVVATAPAAEEVEEPEEELELEEGAEPEVIGEEETEE
ncbi:50S ribosomal protein L25 [Chloroflexota bacterium]